MHGSYGPLSSYFYSILQWIRTWASKIGSCISADPFNVYREFDSLCREEQIIKGLCCLHTTFVSGAPVCYFIFLDFFGTLVSKTMLNLNAYVILNSNQIQGPHCQAHPSQAENNVFPSALRHTFRHIFREGLDEEQESLFKSAYVWNSQMSQEVLDLI